MNKHAKEWGLTVYPEAIASITHLKPEWELIMIECISAEPQPQGDRWGVTNVRDMKQYKRLVDVDAWLAEHHNDPYVCVDARYEVPFVRKDGIRSGGRTLAFERLYFKNDCTTD